MCQIGVITLSPTQFGSPYIESRNHSKIGKTIGAKLGPRGFTALYYIEAYMIGRGNTVTASVVLHDIEDEDLHSRSCSSHAC